MMKYKYEILLFALIQHLFIGIVLRDLPYYTKVIWPLNMLVLGLGSVGVFANKNKHTGILLLILTLAVIALPVSLSFSTNLYPFMILINTSYCIYFMMILWQVMRFLIKPGYINSDLISACVCGYLLLTEIEVFLFQYFYYQNSQCFHGIDSSGTASTYIDLVYYSVITLTSIGFGDITPSSHYTKLLTSLFGIIGQFYTVVLVGILISKFTSKPQE